MSQTEANHTLAGTLWGRISVSGEVLLTVAGSLLIAALAQLAIPVGPVPISGQTLGVLLIAAALGPRRGVQTVLLYLGEGAVGLPVFAGGRAGIAVFAGPTGGYLIGFVAAAFVVGLLARIGWDRRPLTAFAAMTAGSLTIYAFGLPWLAQFTGWTGAIQSGLVPFLFGDALKALIATASLPFAWSLVRRR